MAKQHQAVFTESLFSLRTIRSLGAAAVLEIGIALGVAGILIYQQLHPSPEPPAIQNATVEIPPNPPPPPPPPPRNIPVPQPPQPQPLSEVPPVPTPIPTPNSVPVSPPQPPPIPVSRPANPDAIMNEFIASMTAAVAAAKVYPKEAILSGQTGNSTIEFDYVNGVVSNVKVRTSSGSRSLDRAAMQAVIKALMPPKPAELVNTTHFSVPISFTLGG